MEDTETTINAESAEITEITEITELIRRGAAKRRRQGGPAMPAGRVESALRVLISAVVEIFPAPRPQALRSLT